MHTICGIICNSLCALENGRNKAIRKYHMGYCNGTRIVLFVTGTPDKSMLLSGKARADDIRPYTCTRKSEFKSNQKVSNYGLLRKSGCRGGYHPPARIRPKLKRLSMKVLPLWTASAYNPFYSRISSFTGETPVSARLRASGWLVPT